MNDRIKQIESLCGKLFNHMGRDAPDRPWTGNSDAEDIARDLHRLLGEQLSIPSTANLQERINAVEKKIRPSNQQDVAAFHQAMNQGIEPVPTAFPGFRVTRLRAALVTEEYQEFMRALFLDGSLLWRPVFALVFALLAFITRRAPLHVKLVEVADAIFDLKYVLEGSNLAFGIDGDRIWDIGHASNMAKAGGPVSPEGKRLKPPGWVKPDFRSELIRQGWREQS